MNAISERAYERILACVGKLFECDSLEQLQRVTLAEITALVGCDQITITTAVPTIPKVSMVCEPAFSKAMARPEETLAGHLADLPMLRHYLATGDTGAYKLSDFLSVSHYHALPLYQNLYRQLRYEDQLGFMLFPRGSELISIGLARDRRSFTERDRQTLNLVSPYVAQAYRRAEQLERLQRTLRESDFGRANTRVTAIVLDTRHRPLRFGEGAQEWIRNFFPDDPGNPASLPETIAEWLEGKRADAGRVSSAGGHDTLVQECEGQRLAFRLLPGLRGTERILALGLQRQAGAAHWLLPRILTPRETEVLLEVEEGKSNDEVSVALDISPLTVRKHLEHIFEKLQVASRTAAVKQFRRRCSIFTRAVAGLWVGLLGPESIDCLLALEVIPF